MALTPFSLRRPPPPPPLLLLLLLGLNCLCCCCDQAGMEEKEEGALPELPFECNFAQRYTAEEIVHDGEKRSRFAHQVMQAEGRFHQAGIAYHRKTGMTFDGHLISYVGGDLLPGGLHNFSSGAKDAQHLSILALALEGNPRAVTYVNSSLNSPGPPSTKAAQERALQLLKLKIAALEQWNKTYPGYGGYLPWFSHDPNGDLIPAPDWTNPYRVPALDNGEFYWGLFVAEVALSASQLPGASGLASRYRTYLRLLEKNAATIFLRDDGKTRWVAEIVDVTATPEPSNYRGDGDWGDPYEGELFTWILYWHAPWSSLNLSRDDLWRKKQHMLQAVNYTTDAGKDITVQRGFWFSSHEQWKLLMLPYLEIPLVRRVFENCERARTIHSAEKAIPGLYACVNDVTAGSETIPDYISFTGIPSIAFETHGTWRFDVVTPYAAFPATLVNETVGMAWYHNMLFPDRMQGPYGSVEAINVNGTEISPLLTWDAKALTPLAIMGGVADLATRGLKDASLYESFLEVTQKVYSTAFPADNPLAGEDLPLALSPTTPPPHILSRFARCRPSPEK